MTWELQQNRFYHAALVLCSTSGYIFVDGILATKRNNLNEFVGSRNSFHSEPTVLKPMDKANIGLN